ncbi:MAG: hypothetical protein AAF456_01275 [Planctomycetota bacterium]
MNNITALINRRPATGRLNRRRGITLLFVVSMIVLFLLMGTAFVLVSNEYKKSARIRSLEDLTFEDGTELIEYALYEALVGPDLTNVDSPLRGHSLLGDMYGYGFKAQLSVAPALTGGAGGQLYSIQLQDPVAATPNEGLTIRDQTILPLDTRPGFYSGMVLTITGGNARGISSRIIGYTGALPDNSVAPAIPPYTFIIAPAWGDTFDNAFASAIIGDEVVVNGPAFGGFGAGGYTGAAYPTPALGPTALLPNRRGEAWATIIATGSYLQDNVGINEPYDALDFQNMFLAGNTGEMVEHVDGMPDGWLPSFHRQALADYHAARDPAGLLKPLYMFGVDDDPSIFPGSGTPDYLCDNSGDGEDDSFFMDIGLPVQSDESGRLFKPLVAYRIEDMGGKVNVNTHGSIGHLADGITARQLGYDQATASSGNPSYGLGMGPAEVTLGDIPTPTPLPGLFDSTTYAEILIGNGTEAGRYGADQVPGVAGRDYWSQHKQFGYARGASNAGTGEYGTVGFKFSTAMDIHNRFRILVADPLDTNASFLDPNYAAFPNGQPGIDMLVSAYLDEVADNPYEIDMSPAPGGGRGDRLFRPQELERVLRQFDRDTYSLPSRLWVLGGGLTGQFGQDARTAASITTESWESTRGAVSIRLLEQLATLMQNSGNTTYAGMSIEELILEIQATQLLAPEILAGLPMNMNREWGSGFDENGNGTVDEELPAENEVNSDQLVPSLAGVTTYGNQYGAAAVDMNAAVAGARQLFARHLYMLVLLTCQAGVDYNGDGVVSTDEQNDYRTRIAQWAINVVDFRDADSIHTGFEFDLEPFNGWDVDGIPGTADDTLPERAIVWGSERPELLISETFAGHDGRTEDDGSGTEESRLMPNAFAYVELYNPWTQNLMSQSLPAELYRNGPNGPGVDVTLKTRNNAANGDSVWRLVACRPTRSEPIVRAFYLSNRYTVAPDPDLGSGLQFSSSTGNTSRTVPPGWTCVVGPPGFDSGVAGRENSFPIGRRSGIFPGDEPNNLDTDITRHIALDTANNLVHVQAGDDPAGEISYNAVSVVVDRTRSGLGSRAMNLSDPRNGYPATDASGTPRVPIDDGFSYSDPHTALDTGRNPGVEFTAVELNAIDTTDTNDYLESFRVIKLQRLANPYLDFDPDTNPYITIDRMNTNLVTYNGLESSSSEDLSSFERGENDAGADERMLWRTPGAQTQANTMVAGGAHYINNDLNVSLGATNDAYVNSVFTGPFSVLSWNNRPYANPLELMNVPYLSSEGLVQNYTLVQDAGVFANPYEVDADDTTNLLGGRFGHLPNFYGQDLAGITSRRANLFRLVDFIEIPSRFTGTELYLNGSVFTNNPFNYLSRFRQPGKVNLNTVTNELVWNALMGQYSGYVPYSGVNSFSDVRNDNGIMGLPTEVAKPYRPAGTGNWVPALTGGTPANGLVVEDVDCGLLRRNGAGGGPLFEVLNGGYDSSRSSYKRNHMVGRLSNMTTDRSSVFSVWITVGYFEINPVDGTIVGEIGANTGETTRHRGFFLVDRSIPVAFEPGKRHNVDRMILVQSIIED